MAETLTVLYDGRCSLCVRSAEGLRRADRGRGRVRLVDFRVDDGPARGAGISAADLEGAMHAVHADGRVSRGPEAVRDALRAVGLGSVAWLLGLPVVGPGFRRAYGVVARNRLRWFGKDGCEDGACRVHR